MKLLFELVPRGFLTKFHDKAGFLYRDFHLITDFDNDVYSGKSKLDDILEKQSSTEDPHQPQIGGFSFGKFSSIVTRKRADGVRIYHSVSKLLFFDQF